jgi:alpha-D-xyloside xylohydrolase
MGPMVQYATEQPAAPYEVRIYPGADARFTMYEDDNETYNYEKGQYAAYDLVWNDKARTLTIGARKGRFPGLVARRTLNLVLAGDGGAAGLSPAAAARRVVYDGRAVTVRFGR